MIIESVFDVVLLVMFILAVGTAIAFFVGIALFSDKKGDKPKEVTPVVPDQSVEGLNESSETIDKDLERFTKQFNNLTVECLSNPTQNAYMISIISHNHPLDFKKIGNLIIIVTKPYKDEMMETNIPYYRQLDNLANLYINDNSMGVYKAEVNILSNAEFEVHQVGKKQIDIAYRDPDFDLNDDEN